MRNIYLLISSITLALFLSACGDDGDGKFDTGEEKITVTTCENYITLQTNDTLVKDDNNTTVKIIHDSNNTKQVCIVTGSAHIIRATN